MTNDDKDLKLKECPFCGHKAIHRIEQPRMDSDNIPTHCKCSHGPCLASKFSWPIKQWNSRATPQQPSEPLKELDEKAILMVLDQCCPVSMDKMAKEMIAQILWNKFGQPSEKKAVSVTDIENIILSHNLNGNDVPRRLAQAIFDALPAQREVRYPEKRYCRDGEHGLDCRECADCFIHNNAIDEFKKLNGG